jgi:hypothetical protein
MRLSCSNLLKSTIKDDKCFMVWVVLDVKTCPVCGTQPSIHYDSQGHTQDARHPVHLTDIHPYCSIHDSTAQGILNYHSSF